MPVVPSYDNYQAQADVVNPRGLAYDPTPPVAPPSVADNIGQGMSEAGRAMTAVALRQQADVNEAEVKSRAASAMQQGGALLNDPQNGYLYAVGQAAVQGRDATLKALNDVFSKAADGLANDDQRKMWADASTHLMQQFVNQVNVHAGTQAKEFNAQQSAALAQAAGNIVVANAPAWNVPGGQFQQNLDSARQQAVEAAKLHFGVEPGTQPNAATQDLIGLATQKAMSQIHTDVISNLLARGMSADAKAYLDNYVKTTPDLAKGDIDPAQLAKLQAVVDKGDKVAQAVSTVDKAQAMYGSDGAKIEQYLHDTLGQDGEALQAARSEWGYRQGQAQQQTRQADETSRGKLQLMVEQNQSWGAINASPAMQALRMSDASGSPTAASDMAFVKSYFDSHQRELQAKSNEDKMASLVGFQTLMQLRQDNPQGFATMDVVKTAKNLGLTPAQTKEIILMQGAVNKNDAREAAFNSAYTLARRIYEPLLQSTGISTPALPTTGKITPQQKADATTAAKDRVAQFETQVQGDIQSWMANNNGKQPGYKDLQGIIQQNIAPVFIHGTGRTSWLYDQTGGRYGTAVPDVQKPYYQLTPDEMKNAYSISAGDLAKQSPAQYRQLYQTLQSRLGRAPTNGEIENQYTKQTMMRTRGISK